MVSPAAAVGALPNAVLVLADGLMLDQALYRLCGSSCVGFGVVGGTLNPEYRLAPDDGVRVCGMLGRFGGGGYCADTFDHGFPLTPDAVGYRVVRVR